MEFLQERPKRYGRGRYDGWKMRKMHEKQIMFKCEKKEHLGRDCPPKEDKKKAPNASFSPRKMKGKDAHTHIKALVALMDKDEKEALFKAAEEEGF